ncbi:hypothetical protein QZN30_03715 [Burkholderia multivorans]|nr:hypothetical protein [Burkholderia multivorans]
MTTATLGLFADKTARSTFRENFRQLARARKLTAQHMALYAILMGKKLDRTFSPITNTTKLANGLMPWDGAASALASLAFAPDAASSLLCDAEKFAHARSLAKLGMPALLKQEG